MTDVRFRELMEMKYDDDMDPECIKLCEAINKLKGIVTTCSCCGHGDHSFWMFFDVIDPVNFPILLYFIDPCHVGFRWYCFVYTDSTMCLVHYRLESMSIGEKAYKEADIIASKIEKHIKEEGLIG